MTVEISDDLVRDVMKHTHEASEQAAIEAGLRSFASAAEKARMEALYKTLEWTPEEEANFVYKPLNPNAETIEAMEAARRGEVTRFTSVEDLMAELNADD